MLKSYIRWHKVFFASIIFVFVLNSHATQTKNEKSTKTTTQTKITQSKTPDELNFQGFEITPTLNYAFAEKNTGLKNHIGGGIRFGYTFDDLGLELGSEYYKAKNKNANGGGQTNLFRTYANALIPYRIGNKADFYVLGGLGYENTSKNANNTINRNGGFFHFGTGVKYRLSQNFGLRAEIRDELKFRGKDSRFITTLGFIYNPQKPKQEPPKPRKKPIVTPIVTPKPLPKYCKDLTLVNVYFDFDKYNLKEKDKKLIKELSQKIKSDDAYFVYISGHTDNRGSLAYNERLSKRRAYAVLKELNKNDIDASRINPNWYGFSKQAFVNDTRLNRAKNRRTEIRIVCEQNRAPNDEIKDLDKRSGYLGKPFKIKNDKKSKKKFFQNKTIEIPSKFQKTNIKFHNKTSKKDVK